MSALQAQVSSTHAIRIGKFTITAILESHLPAPEGLLTNASQMELVQRQQESLRGDIPFVSISCFLIEDGSQKVLVDAGLGGGPSPQQGRLAEELATLGVRPADIDHVLLTHLHADHFGGLFDGAGECIFQRATFCSHEQERLFCFEQEGLDAAPPVLEQFELAQRLRPLLHRFRWITGGEVLPGIELVPLPGHTPGHSGFRISSDGQSILLWGDIVHQPQHQFVDPKVGVSFDVDAEQARRTRQQVMTDVAKSREIIGGTHTDFPCFGRVRSTPSGFEFVPLVWASAIATPPAIEGTGAR